ncbi:MAG: glycosyltransferase family 39 protein [Bacteroidota bacterium]
MQDYQRPQLFWQGLLALASAKLLVHLYAHNIYGLHRDEYLYIAEGDHLSWGYMEVPPMIAVLAKVATGIFGNTPFAVRLFPMLIGAISIFIVGMMVREFGGKRMAQMLAAGAFLLSPAYLGSNNLFQPVSFNQFCWLLSAYWVVRIINTKQPRYWYFLGITAGLGFLTKYSIVFFLLAVAGGFLLTPQRKLLANKHPYLAVGLALLIAAPNLYWQYSYDWPVMRHMADLAQTQLVYMTPADFLLPQFLFHWSGTLIWLAGLWGLFRLTQLQPFRVLGWAYVLVLLLLLALSGKAYYSLGAYAMLLAAGGVMWEHWLKQHTWILLPLILLLNAGIIPYGLPLMSVEKMQQYSAFMRDNFGLSTPLRWEDGQFRSIPQDFADMHGWDELPQKVAELYHNLPEEVREKTMLYGGSYGHAGVLNFYREKYDLPECHSFNSSFAMWVPEDLEFEYQIQLDDRWQADSPYFDEVQFVDSIAHPLARDPGFIFFKTGAKEDLSPVWKEIVIEQKKEAGLYQE